MFTKVKATLGKGLRRTALVAMAVAVSAIGPLALAAPAFATAPSAPVNVRAYTGGNSIAVVWNPAPGSTPAYYDVWRNDTYVTTLSPTNVNGGGDAQRYIDTAVTNGTSYTYNIVAFNDADEESAWSADATITHVATTVPTVTLDPSVAAAGLTAFFNNGKAVIQTWYPKFVYLFGSQAGTPTAMTLKTQTGVGLARTEGGTTINFDTAWATAHATDPTAAGVFIHESVHVFHSPDAYYPWVHEGIADYLRGYIYADNAYTMPTATQDWQIGYDKAAYFFKWISTTYNKPNFVKDLYASFAPNFVPTFFKTQTGLTVGELWQQMNSTRMSSPLTFKNVAASLKCLDLVNGSTADFTNFQLQTCSANPWAQNFLWFPDSTTSNQGAVKIYGKCMDVTSSGTTDGTAVKLYTCNSTVAQKWIMMSDGSLKNPNSGKCLQPVNGATTVGTFMEIRTCTGGDIQDWLVRPPGMLKIQAGFGCMSDASLSPVKIWSCNDGQASQNFRYLQTTPGSAWGAFKNVNSNYCLEPIGGSAASGAKVELVTCDGSTPQQWQWQADSTVKNNNSGLCLTLAAWAAPWEVSQTSCASPTTLKKFDLLYQY